MVDPEQRKKILELNASGWTQTRIAKELRIHRSTVARVLEQQKMQHHETQSESSGPASTTTKAAESGGTEDKGDGAQAKSLFRIFKAGKSLVEAQMETGFNTEIVEQIYDAYLRFEQADLSKDSTPRAVKELDAKLSQLSDIIEVLGRSKIKSCRYLDPGRFCFAWTFHVENPHQGIAESVRPRGEKKYQIVPTAAWCALCHNWQSREQNPTQAERTK